MIRLLKKVLSLFLVVSFLTVAMGAIVATQAYRFWIQLPGEGVEFVGFSVEDGQTFSSIADDLNDAGLIQSKFWFKVYARMDGSAHLVQAGNFGLRPGMSYSVIIDNLGIADVDEVSITIPEGYTIKQIGELVREKFEVTEAEWGILTGMESLFEDHPFIIFAQKPADVDLEGYLFPDTYRFFKDATAEDIIKKLIETMQERVADENIIPPTDWTLHDVLTLASILEREVMLKDEKAMVADLFRRRLDIGMALQADSTVNYVTGKKTPGISLADRDINSPYNTYQHAGLPPGPISNPGIDSIRAVVNPTPNSYFFFLTTEAGEVIYAVTHDEHVSNKNKYLR